MTLVCDHEFEVDTLHLDQRREHRVEQERPAAVFDPTTARTLQCRTRNISATGLQIAFGAVAIVSTGRVIHVHVGRSKGNFCLPNRRQMMPARVVWSRQDHTTGECLCGVELMVTMNASRGAA